LRNDVETEDWETGKRGGDLAKGRVGELDSQM
jgi:hypothetical protein